eukprot:scaffold1771_cov384-Prasinococcus_capsulatus_cf.AAC.2
MGYVLESADSVNILVEQLQMYRDKQEIFMRALHVLLCMCDDSLVARKVAGMPDIVRRTQALARLMKIRVEKEQRLRTIVAMTPMRRGITSSYKDIQSRAINTENQLKMLHRLLEVLDHAGPSENSDPNLMQKYPPTGPSH